MGIFKSCFHVQAARWLLACYRFCMKKISTFLLILAGSLGMVLFAQQGPKDDIKDAGKEIKKAGKATARAAKKTGSATKKATKKGVHKAADKVEDGAQAVKDKTK